MQPPPELPVRAALCVRVCLSAAQIVYTRYGLSPPTDDCMMSESRPAGEGRLTEGISAKQVARSGVPGKDGRNEFPD